MTDHVPFPVRQAAEARASGASWTGAAEAAGWDVAGLRRWVRAHPRPWARELGRARREARDAACDEAVAVLRKQLRAQEAKTALGAAVALADRFAPRRGRPAAAEPVKRPATFEELFEMLPPGEVDRMAERLGYPEDEYTARMAAMFGPTEGPG